MFECKVCNNKDKRYIGYKNNIPYCRKCIQLKTNAVEKLDYEECARINKKELTKELKLQYIRLAVSQGYLDV